ncbi:MAG: hypothetical protein ACREOH_01900, partial [Candidatus Entotheonellia bacterium]
MAIDVDSRDTPMRQAIQCLYLNLNIIPTPQDFGCPYLHGCSRQSEIRGIQFCTGNWAYVGVDYGKGKINGKNAKILVIAMDRGGYCEAENEKFPDTQKAFREATEYPGNAHMGGVS